jgi:hypothetical protein
LVKLNFSSKCTFNQLPSDTVKECRQSAKFVNRCNIVVRDVRDRNGNKLGTVVEPHDATEAGVIAAAQRATDRMYEEYPEASNIQSRIGLSRQTSNTLQRSERMKPPIFGAMYVRSVV